MFKLKKAAILVIVSLLSIGWLTVPLAAADTTANQAVTQGYSSDYPLQLGMIVKLSDKDSSKVEPLTAATATQMQGVVVAPNDASFTLSNDGNTGQVFVATFGHYDVLVSNQNGPINPGDYIAISALAGVGMKADSKATVVVGKAVARFDGTSNVQGSATVKDGGGHSINVALGRVPVDISISHNPLQENINNNFSGFLKRFSTTVSDKPVSMVRIYISLAILLATTIIAGILLYSGIHSGIIAIGRNPLAKKLITRNIIQVIAASIGLFLAGLACVYLLLRL